MPFAGGGGRIMAEAIATRKQSKINEQQVVVFDLTGETFGIAIHVVREVVRMQRITSSPRRHRRSRGSSICAAR